MPLLCIVPHLHLVHVGLIPEQAQGFSLGGLLVCGVEAQESAHLLAWFTAKSQHVFEGSTVLLWST